MKYGYQNVDELKERSQKEFSLVEDETVNMNSTRLLLVNGVLDGFMPIEDSMLLFDFGKPKEARFYPDAVHMGYPKECTPLTLIPVYLLTVIIGERFGMALARASHGHSQMKRSGSNPFNGRFSLISG